MKPYETSDLAKELMRFLDCPCQVFGPMEDDDPLLEAYQQAQKQGALEGFTPLLIKVDDTLWECMTLNCDPEHEPDFSIRAVRAWRKALLAEPLPDGTEYLEYLREKRRQECQEDGLPWPAANAIPPAQGQVVDRICSPWNYSTNLTDEMILAQIPTQNPWEVFAWVPMGGWNDCPDTPELMAAAKLWHQQFGALPAAISHDELEFLLPQPAAPQLCPALALCHYAFCPDRVEQCEEDGLGALVDSLKHSNIWYFWWD